VVHEVGEIQLEPVARFHANERTEAIDVLGLAVGRETHHLELVAVLGEAEVLRDRRVQEPHRVREFDPVADRDGVGASDAPHRADEIAEPVN
jgi:hypothetical protein